MAHPVPKAVFGSTSQAVQLFVSLAAWRPRKVFAAIFLIALGHIVAVASCIGVLVGIAAMQAGKQEEGKRPGGLVNLHTYNGEHLGTDRTIMQVPGGCIIARKDREVRATSFQTCWQQKLTATELQASC